MIFLHHRVLCTHLEELCRGKPAGASPDQKRQVASPDLFAVAIVRKSCKCGGTMVELFGRTSRRSGESLSADHSPAKRDAASGSRCLPPSSGPAIDETHYHGCGSLFGVVFRGCEGREVPTSANSCGLVPRAFTGWWERAGACQGKFQGSGRRTKAESLQNVLYNDVLQV